MPQKKRSEHEGSIKSERDFSESDNQVAASLQAPPGPTPRTVGPRASATLPTVIYSFSLFYSLFYFIFFHFSISII